MWQVDTVPCVPSVISDRSEEQPASTSLVIGDLVIVLHGRFFYNPTVIPFTVRSVHVSSVYTITADKNLRFDGLFWNVRQTTKQSLIALSQNEHIFNLTNLWNSLNAIVFHIKKICTKK